MHVNDLVGKCFGELLVLCKVHSDRNYFSYWKCLCNCGQYDIVRIDNLTAHKIYRCRICSHKSRIRHGHTKEGKISSEYHSYHDAKQRCLNPKDAGYENYGGRGIQFLFKDFKEFIACVGLKPSPKYSIDRIDNDGHYERGNVRWATREEQRANRRDSVQS